MTNKERFLKLVSNEKTNTLENNRVRIKNRAMLRESQNIAIKVMAKLDELGWSQKDLAEEMEVKPQQITKILSGKENLTIETQIRLQNVLDIPVLASYYENKMNDMEELVLKIEKRVEKIAAKDIQTNINYQEGKSIKIERPIYAQEYYQLVG